MFTINLLCLTPENMYFIKDTNIVSFWPGKWFKTGQNNTSGKIIVNCVLHRALGEGGGGLPRVK